jgi:uncharacterized protein
MLRYNVSSLIRADFGSQQHLAIDESPVNLGQNFTADFLRGKLRLTRTDQHILVEGSLYSAVPAECVRCLEPFRQHLQIPIEEQFALAPGSHATDPLYVVEQEGTIDLTWPMREQIQLSLPIQPICAPDCKGLCPQCGKNLNEGRCDCTDESIDPRLVSLKTLL